MNALQSQDTICAIAIANGIGSIGLIRVSGDNSLQIVSSIFSKDLQKRTTHTTHFGTIQNKEKELIDEVLLI